MRRAGARAGAPAMTLAIHGLPVARNIAIGRAVLVAASWADVAHYFIEPAQVEAEIDRVRAGRNAVVDEIHRLQQSIAQMAPKDAPQELRALLDVHLMLLQDEELISGVKQWILAQRRASRWARVGSCGGRGHRPRRGAVQVTGDRTPRIEGDQRRRLVAALRHRFRAARMERAAG